MATWWQREVERPARREEARRNAGFAAFTANRRRLELEAWEADRERKETARKLRAEKRKAGALKREANAVRKDLKLKFITSARELEKAGVTDRSSEVKQLTRTRRQQRPTLG